MDGFVASLAAARAGRGVQDSDAGVVMGYCEGADVPVYEHLADESVVCDRWFGSVPLFPSPLPLSGLPGRPRKMS
jgi:phospholipase C